MRCVEKPCRAAKSIIKLMTLVTEFCTGINCTKLDSRFIEKEISLRMRENWKSGTCKSFFLEGKRGLFLLLLPFSQNTMAKYYQQHLIFP